MAKRRGRHRSISSNASHPGSSQGFTAPAQGTARQSRGETVEFFHQHDIVWLLLACALPVVLCFIRLNDDLWYDEIYTLSFAEQPLSAIAQDYSAPNNHVLFTMLLRPFYALSPINWMLRLPSLFSSIATLICVFYLGRRLGGVPLGMASTLALGLNQMFLGHTMQVRGYSLSMALTAALAIAVFQAGRRSRRRAVAVMILAAALVYTIPTNAIVAASLAVAAIGVAWFTARQWKAVAFEFVIWIVAGLIVAGLYLPLYEQVLAANSEAAAGTWASNLRLAGRFYWAALHDFVFLVPLASLGLVFIVRSAATRNMDDQLVEDEKQRKHSTMLAWALIIMLTVPFLVTAILGLSPFERVYTPLLPFVAMAVAWTTLEGTQALMAFVARKRNRPLPRPMAVGVVTLLLIAVATIPWLLTYSQRLTTYRQRQFAQDGYFNYYAANYHPSQVAAYLKRVVPHDQPFLIVYDDADMLNLRWYLADANVESGRLMDTPQGDTLARVFLVQPPMPQYDWVASQTGLSEAALKKLPRTADFGYYRVYASPGLLSLEIPEPEDQPAP